MYQRTRDLVLHWLKVPPEPHPPAGNPASLRVFRAGKNELRLRLFVWATAEALALAGIIFWTVVLIGVEDAVRAQRSARAAPPPSPVARQEINDSEPVPAPSAKATAKNAKNKKRSGDWTVFKQSMVEFAARWPPWGFPLVWVVKIGGVLLFLAQVPFTYAIRRLDFEMRWYVVTDRSLRIRTGVWRVQELTMSFANLQQVAVTQGPLQRLLGLADVRVQSAGGGSRADGHQKGHHDSLHTATFHAVENATEIRDLILERLRQFRASGLGDPDDHHDAPRAYSANLAPALAAAHELLAEAQALRRTLAPK